MKIIIPMAGTGARFVEQGYQDPKPLIAVDGIQIIEYIVSMFCPNDEFIFICNETHIATTNITYELKKLAPNCKILTIPDHKKGPVWTLTYAFDFMDDEEVIVSYCDNPLVWNYSKFKEYINRSLPGGCILTHIGFHPHTLNNTKMAFLKVNGEIVSEIKEKESYTDDPMQEHASTGVYYFKSGNILKYYCKRALEENLTYKGEYYVTLLYNLLIKDAIKVTYYDTKFVTVFGTPEEVKNFEAWQHILTMGQVQSEKDLIACYKYWRLYNEETGHKSRHRRNNMRDSG